MNADIPLTFPSVTDPDLKRDLERLANGVSATQRSASRTFASNFAMSRPATLSLAASFGQVTRIAPLKDTDSIIVSLPLVDPRNGGKQLGVLRTGSLGCVYLVPPGTLINGRRKLMLLGSKLLTTVTFDGLGYYADNDGSAPWGGL